MRLQNKRLAGILLSVIALAVIAFVATRSGDDTSGVDRYSWARNGVTCGRRRRRAPVFDLVNQAAQQVTLQND
ncbi:hypothetical protein [Streptomyces sp. NPDC001020]